MSDSETQITIDAALPADTPTPQPPANHARKKAARGAWVKSEIELLAEVSAKLDLVVAVLAAHGKDIKDQILILATAGCDSHFIGTVVGKTSGAVRNYAEWRQAKGESANSSEERP